MSGQPPNGTPESWQPPEGHQQRPPKSGWQIAGIVLAVIVAIGGLAILALVVAFFVAMSQFGSNK